MSIVLEQLTKRYEGHPVVNRVSLEVADGEFFVLIGPSGSGKSTVLRMIAGLNSVDQGRALRQIQTDLGITTIFVTHDQEEAFELGDRLGVMNFGRLLEVGRPAELYQRPQTEFVATFLGTGNLLAGQLDSGEVRVGPLRFPLATQAVAGPAEDGPQPVQVLFRPEDVLLSPTAEGLGASQLGQGHVEHSAFSGAFERVRLRLPAVSGLQPIAPRISFGDNS